MACLRDQEEPDPLLFGAQALLIEYQPIRNQSLNTDTNPITVASNQVLEIVMVIMIIIMPYTYFLPTSQPALSFSRHKSLYGTRAARLHGIRNHCPLKTFFWSMIVKTERTHVASTYSYESKPKESPRWPFSQQTPVSNYLDFQFLAISGISSYIGEFSLSLCVQQHKMCTQSQDATYR